MNGDLAFEPDGGYVVVVLSNLDPPAAGRVSAFILERLPPPRAHRRRALTNASHAGGAVPLRGCVAEWR
jgi:hypothetical protein